MTWGGMPSEVRLENFLNLKDFKLKFYDMGGEK